MGGARMIQRIVAAQAIAILLARVYAHWADLATVFVWLIGFAVLAMVWRYIRVALGMPPDPPVF